MSYTAAERETIVTVSDADEVVSIWTARRTDITKLRKNPKATEVETGEHHSVFTIPADQWNPATGIKRTVNMSPEAKAAAAQRLEAARAAREVLAEWGPKMTGPEWDD